MPSSSSVTVTPVQRVRVVSKHEFAQGKLVLREYEGVDACDGAALLAGFPSVSLTSILVANFFSNELHLPLVGSISSTEFAVRAVVEKGQPAGGIRIFGDSRLVVVLCETKLSPTLQWAAIEAILDFSKRHQISTITTAEGLPSEEVTVDPKVHFISTHPIFFDQLAASGATPLSDAVVDGMTGGFLAEAPLSETHFTCVLASQSHLDPGAGAALTLAKVLKMLVPKLESANTDILELQAGKISSTLKGAVSAHERESEASRLFYS